MIRSAVALLLPGSPFYGALSLPPSTKTSTAISNARLRREIVDIIAVTAALEPARTTTSRPIPTPRETGTWTAHSSPSARGSTTV